MITLKAVKKAYTRGAEQVWALKGIDLELKQGDFVAVTGESGSGKTTLMHIIGLLDSPTEGQILIDDRQVNLLSDKELTLLRRQKIGFVFQHFYLIPGLTVAENITLPLLFSGKTIQRSKLDELIEIVGLKDRAKHTTSQLSGGQMQRVAIARALVSEPEVILADEPTGNLDTDNSHRIMDIFVDINRLGKTIVIVTHNIEIAQKSKVQIRLKDGMIV
ncbi:MAG: ABC transporter ATP-binding protein [Thermodesulfovibrionales bacterium]|nr:ABC transporter ATP-binding protein [Thermodesulfovibrionales bacterium]